MFVLRDLPELVFFIINIYLLLISTATALLRSPEQSPSQFLNSSDLSITVDSNHYFYIEKAVLSTSVISIMNLFSNGEFISLRRKHCGTDWLPLPPVLYEYTERVGSSSGYLWGRAFWDNKALRGRVCKTPTQSSSPIIRAYGSLVGIIIVLVHVHLYCTSSACRSCRTRTAAARELEECAAACRPFELNRS